MLLEFVCYYPSGDGFESLILPRSVMEQKHLCCFPYVCVCPPSGEKNDGKKEIERKKNQNVGEVEADLLGLGLQRLSCSDCGREKETEKGDFDRSEFVEGFYFLQILIFTASSHGFI